MNSLRIRPFPIKSWPTSIGVLLTLIATSVAIGALAVLGPELSSGIYYIPLTVVSIASVLFGFSCGLISTVISTLGIDFFVFPPTLQFGRNDPGDDLRLAVFAGISLLVTSVGGYARNLRRRAEGAERRQRFLVEASLMLSESLDYETTLEKITQLAVPEFADASVVQLIGPSNSIESMRSACRDARRRTLIEEYLKRYASDLKGDSILAAAIQTGQSQVVNNVGEFLESRSKDIDRLIMLRQIMSCSLVVVPFCDHGHSFGAIGFASYSPTRRYGSDEVTFFEELGRRCSTAMLNASLFRETRRAIAARDDFISIASHELKTPLTSLYLHLNLLCRAYRRISEKMTGDSSGGISRELQQIERQADRLTVLVDQLLDLSRIRVGKLMLEKGSMDLVDVASDVVRQFRESEDAPSIDFVGATPILGEWDRDRLEQVVSNLVSNAIKYGNHKPIDVRVEFDSQNSVARLTVRDRGPGIPQEFRSKMFGRFERGPSSGGSGLGLGLYIVRQIVEAHGGEVAVESEIGTGSTFIVVLPIDPDMTAAC